MERHVKLQRTRGLVAIMFLAALLTATTAPAQAAGPYDTFTVTPCRVLDTRLSNPQGPIAANSTRSFLVTGDLTAGGTINQGGMPNCNVPDTAQGVFINVVAVTALAPAWLTVYPSNTGLPNASTLNFATGQTVANGILVPICTPGASCVSDLNVSMGPGGAHLVVDVTGYLLPTP